MKMQYREAVLTDAREIAALASKMWTSHTVEELAECFSAAINAPDCAVFLVTDGDKASDLHSADCGTIMWRERQAVLSAILEGIFVEEPYRKQGCAKQLLDCCEQWAKEKSCTEFASDCELDNEISRQFHLGAGFREANRIVCFVKKI